MLLYFQLLRPPYEKFYFSFGLKLWNMGYDTILLYLIFKIVCNYSGGLKSGKIG